MVENEEVEEWLKETGAKRKRKLRKREKWMIIGAVLITGIIAGAYIAMVLTAPTEKYWKPNGFKMPAVDWSTVKDSYTVQRTLYDQDGQQGPLINQTIGSERSDGRFRVEIAVKVKDYCYYPNDTDGVSTVFYVSFSKLGSDYRVKELVFKYRQSDENVSLMLTNDPFFAANLYFTWDKFDYEWRSLHEIRGINKDAQDIKEGGFSTDFEICLYDEYPHWSNHSVTMTAVLKYGRYVNGLFGSRWEDVHTLQASVILYIVPEGGE